MPATTILSQTQFDLLCDAFWDNANSGESDVRTDYSGRGMSGDTCIGFVAGSMCEVVRVFLAVAAEDDDLAAMLAANLHEDNMARDVIVYFPGIKAPAGEGSTDE